MKKITIEIETMGDGLITTSWVHSFEDMKKVIKQEITREDNHMIATVQLRNF